MPRVSAKIDRKLFKKLERRLGAAPKKLKTKLLKKAVRDAARPVLDDAKRFVPTDTGRLKKSIKLRALKRSRTRTRAGIIGVRIVTSKSDNVFAGSTYYGGMVEFGTDRMPARSFMRFAMDINEGTVKDVYRAAVRKILKELR